MDVTLHSWMIPLSTTIGLLLIACWRTGRYQSRGDYDFGGGLLGLFWLALWIIGSLVAWLAWALFR